MPSIRRLAIAPNQHWHRCDLEEYLFALLAKHGPLKELKWGMLMLPALVEKAMEITPRPFHQIRHLDCHATNTALSGLLPCLLNLEVLIVRLYASPSRPRAMVRLNILPSLARCTKLRAFKLSASPAHTVLIPLQAILDFARASNQLEQLELDGGNFENVRVSDITDSHLDTMVSQLPGLRKLVFKPDLMTSISTRSLFSLSARCRALEELDLGGVFDLSLHGSLGRVLLPNLRKATLGRINGDGNGTSAHDCAVMMLYYAPKSTLKVRHTDVFGASVHEAHRRLFKTREFNDHLKHFLTV